MAAKIYGGAIKQQAVTGFLTLGKLNTWAHMKSCTESFKLADRSQE